jgi:3-dehydroquinate dehydratase
MNREEFRRHSVIRDVCFASVWGKGVDGYRDALAAARDAIAAAAATAAAAKDAAE